MNNYEKEYKEALERAKILYGKLIEEYEDRLDRCACESFNKGYKAAIEHQKEKQGEQKETLCDKCKKAQPSHSCQDITALGRCYIQNINTSTNNNEPKFKVGDWVVDNCGYTWKIEGILNQFYLLEGVEGGESRPTIEWVNKTFHLWNIEDAKDGDILATKTGGIFIYKELLYNKPFAYCGVDKFGVFKDCNCGKGLDWTPYLSNVTPATQEQRDLLFTKMHEAGYVRDAEKRELNGIDTYCKENCKGFQETGKCYCDGGCDAKIDAEKKELKKIENKNPLLSDFFKAEYERGKSDALKCVEWSEEDIEMLKSAISFVEHSAFTTIGKGKNNVISWLKSLKDRIRPQQEWGEEDEKCLSTIIAEFSKCAGKSVSKDEWMRCNDFLHCIRDRVKSKQEWSHEDDVMVHDILGCLPTKTKPEYNKRREDWIKSLKNRIQPQQEWSEEDEKMLQNILECLRHGWKKLPTDILKYENWLKSLRPQNKWISVDEEIYVKEPVLAQRKTIKEGDVFKGYVICADHTLTPDVYKCYSPINTIMYENRWKPSDEQVKALANACDGKVLLLDYLNSLYEDLKKLKN